MTCGNIPARTRAALSVGLAGLALLAAGGCGRQGVETVEELAAALRAQGVAFEVTESTALASIRAEGLRLTGPELDVELYCIDDEADLKRALIAAALTAAAQRAAGRPDALAAYAYPPFLALVRAEPAEGRVRRALEAALAK